MRIAQPIEAVSQPARVLVGRRIGNVECLLIAFAGAGQVSELQQRITQMPQVVHKIGMAVAVAFAVDSHRALEEVLRAAGIPLPQCAVPRFIRMRATLGWRGPQVDSATAERG